MITTINGLLTLLLIILFLGIWKWAWSEKNKKQFNDMSRLPLEDDEQSAEGINHEQ